MSEDTFLTIKAPAEGLFKAKGSKFIAFAYPVQSEDEIKEIIVALKKEHHSARHHCWAYRLGFDKTQFRANDDGEPSNSAGKPILGQIQALDLSNVLVVVVRYFGGTLLGVGGLIQAYKESAHTALANAEIYEAVVEQIFQITFDYLYLNSIMKIVKDFSLKIVNQNFEANCSISLMVRKSLSEKIVDLIQKIETTRLIVS